MKIFAVGLFICCSTSVLGQYFQFSQYNYTPQRINPAYVASSDYAMVNVDYRNQSTDGGFHLNSTIVNVSYPLISARGRWSGLGLSFMDDRSGSAGIFNTQEAALSYAINLDVAPYQSISFGAKVLYQNNKIDLSGLSTGMQYIPDRGFEQSAPSGEDLGQLSNNFVTFSTGVHWQNVDKKGISVAYWDISFFDFNKPENSFMEGSPSSLNGTLVAAAGLRALKKGNMSIYPEVLYTRSASNNVLNVGAVFRCDLIPAKSYEIPHVDFITKYVLGRSGIIGFQYHNDRFSVGFSYDFPLFIRNPANVNTFEIGLMLKKLVVNKKRKENADKKNDQTAKQSQSGKKLGASVGVKKPTVQQQPNSADTTVRPVQAASDISARLTQKQDSVIAQARAGNVSHEPLVLEKATLYFNFEFNSTRLDNGSTDYLDGLAQALTDNPELKITLEGHTDNVGSQKFNIRLSLERAKALKAYLESKGVDEARITVDGRGMAEPLNNNENEDQRARNRRVELKILYKQ